MMAIPVTIFAICDLCFATLLRLKSPRLLHSPLSTTLTISTLIALLPDSLMSCLEYAFGILPLPSSHILYGLSYLNGV